jgi:hypothetical protein
MSKNEFFGFEFASNMCEQTLQSHKIPFEVFREHRYSIYAYAQKSQIINQLSLYSEDQISSLFPLDLDVALINFENRKYSMEFIKNVLAVVSYSHVYMIPVLMYQDVDQEFIENIFTKHKDFIDLACGYQSVSLELLAQKLDENCLSKSHVDWCLTNPKIDRASLKMLLSF